MRATAPKRRQVPTLKYLQDFRFDENPKIPQATITALAEGSWITDRESVILIGDSGTALSGGPAELGEHARRRARCLPWRRLRVGWPALERSAPEVVGPS